MTQKGGGSNFYPKDPQILFATVKNFRRHGGKAPGVFSTILLCEISVGNENPTYQVGIVKRYQVSM